MSTTVVGLDRFLGHIETVSRRANNIDKEVVSGIATRAKQTVIATAAAQIPGGTLSRFAAGKGTLGAKLAAKIVLRSEGRVPEAAIYPTPPGPWYLLEHGGKAHDIARKAKGSRGKRNRSATTLGSTWKQRPTGQFFQPGFLGAPGRFAAVGPVHHPAVAGKHTWSIAADAAIAKGKTQIRSEYTKQYVNLFAGR